DSIDRPGARRLRDPRSERGIEVDRRQRGLLPPKRIVLERYLASTTVERRLEPLECSLPRFELARASIVLTAKTLESLLLLLRACACSRRRSLRSCDLLASILQRHV